MKKFYIDTLLYTVFGIESIVNGNETIDYEVAFNQIRKEIDECYIKCQTYALKTGAVDQINYRRS